MQKYEFPNSTASIGKRFPRCVLQKGVPKIQSNFTGEHFL